MTAMGPQRQALRVPPGWRIDYHEWYEGDLTDRELEQDLLLAVHPELDRVLDVSWYYGDRDTACYRVVVWAGHEPGGLLHVAEHDTHSDAVSTAESLMARISGGEL